MSTFSEMISFVSNQLQSIRVIDILDIFIVGTFFFYLYRFIRERRGGKLAIGIVTLFVISIVSNLFTMHMLSYLIDGIFQVGVIALIVLFQPELRSALERFGQQPMRSLRVFGEQKGIDAIQNEISEITSACIDMGRSRTGALVVCERETKLGDIVRTGTVINADVNAFLLRNIFFNKAPMHDGAVIVSKGRIYSAGCFLPLSQNQDIIKDLGTRHRAGIGMSENSDAVVIIVSEETGTISTAVGGKLVTGYNENTLRSFLTKELIHQNIQQKLRERTHVKEQVSAGEEHSDGGK